MRLFIAANLPQDAIEALQDNLEELAEVVTGRAVKPETLHVTLAFLDETDEELVPAICEALDAACAGVTRFPIVLDDYDHFGKKSCATLWQGFEDPSGFELLADRVRGELDARDIYYDHKDFAAHVTMMRMADLATVEANGGLEAPYSGEGDVESITLFRSHLSSGGPTYEPLYTVELEAPYQRGDGPLLIIDADACPTIKESLTEARAASIPVLLVGNATQNLEKHLKKSDPTSPRKGFWVHTITAQMGADSADFSIVVNLREGDVVVTQDIGLASMVLGKGAAAIGVRGKIYSPATIDSMMLIRHEEKKVRRAGGRTQGPSAFNSEDRGRFSRNLRRLLREAANR